MILPLVAECHAPKGALARRAQTFANGSLPPDAARVHGRARPSDAYLRHVNQNRVAVGDQ